MTEEQYHDLTGGIADLGRALEDLTRLIDGDARRDVLGIRPRLALVENRVKDIPMDLVTRIVQLEVNLADERNKRIYFEQRWIGAKVVLGAFGITSVASLGLMIRLLMGAG